MWLYVNSFCDIKSVGMWLYVSSFCDIKSVGVWLYVSSFCDIRSVGMWLYVHSVCVCVRARVCVCVGVCGFLSGRECVSTFITILFMYMFQVISSPSSGGLDQIGTNTRTDGMN
jgi:hypothetical protein